MIYVDALRHHAVDAIKPEARRHGRIWCHLWTDGAVDELHAFARRIGLKREWFQDHATLPHYDLTPAMRSKALGAGAQQREAHDHIRAQRAQRETT